MTRIGATIQGFEQMLLTQLNRSNQQVAASAFRLSTGKNFNSPADDPSAFLQVQLWESQLSHLSTVRANVETAANLGAGLQTTLDQMRTQLNTIRAALVEDEDNTVTTEQRETNQTTIDSAIAALRTLARTSVEGKRFLDGSFDFTASGKDSAQIRTVDVFSLPSDTTLSGTVTSAATQTVRRYNGAAGRITADATFTLTGKRGAATISVTNNELLTNARDRINLDSHRTGILASVSGNQLNFTTVDYGDEATMDVAVSSGSFSTSSIATGADAAVTINGTTVSTDDIDGNRVFYNQDGVRLAVEFQAGFSGAFTSFTVSADSAARFSLSTRTSDLTTFGLPSLFPELLGGISGEVTDLETGGSLAGLGTNTSAAIRVIDETLSRLTSIEARVDSFADITVGSAANLLEALETDLEESLDDFNTVDEDAEELRQARYANLSSNAVSAIAVWQQQQNNLVGLLQVLAGLG